MLRTLHAPTATIAEEPPGLPGKHEQGTRDGRVVHLFHPGIGPPDGRAAEGNVVRPREAEVGFVGEGENAMVDVDVRGALDGAGDDLPPENVAGGVGGAPAVFLDEAAVELEGRDGAEALDVEPHLAVVAVAHPVCGRAIDAALAAVGVAETWAVLRRSRSHIRKRQTRDESERRTIRIVQTGGTLVAFHESRTLVRRKGVMPSTGGSEMVLSLKMTVGWRRVKAAVPIRMGGESEMSSPMQKREMKSMGSCSGE